MTKFNRTTLFSALIVLAYVLSACSGAPAGQSTNDQQSSSGQAQEVVFTGTVENVNGNQWTISGQTITVEGGTTLGANIAVGDNVKVEARVAADGTVTAVQIEISGADDTNSNSNSSNGNDSNANDNTSNSNDNQGDNSNTSNGNGNGNGNGNDNSGTGVEQEVSGIVGAITTESITINGVVYMIADFTEFKDLIAAGDQVKLHVIVNADGSLTIREIEKSGQPGLGNDNSNSNGNGPDDNSNVNSNSNGDDQGGNGNDDNGNDDQGNDNSNDNGDDSGNDNDGGGNDDNGGNGNGNG